MSSYHLTQLYPQILAVSDSVTMGLAILGVILLITLGAIWKYPQVNSVLQLWAAFGTLTGAIATYFFTREQVQRQEAQIKTIESAFQASEKQKVAAARQVLQVATAINRQLDSATAQAWVKSLEFATDKLTPVYTSRTIFPSPSPHATEPDTFHDPFKRNAASPSPVEPSP